MVLINRYLTNPITKAIVIAGMEPFDTPDLIYDIVLGFREIGCMDDIVIYTGYRDDEVQPYIDRLKAITSNVIIKFGRFVPDQQSHYDKVLGVKLASDNQKGVRIC